MGLASYVKRAIRFIIKGEPINKAYIEVKVSNPNEMLFKRNILITGGANGLGFACAKKCIAEGAKVIITGRHEKNLKVACESLGEGAYYIVNDISATEDFAPLISEAEKIAGGKIDSLVSNAGVSFHEGDFRNVTPEGWDAQMNTNLKGNYFLIQSFVKYLETKNDTRGNIVVITSERAKRPDDIPYGLSKVASNSFIECIANKIASNGIRINGVAPGVTATNMTGVAKDGNYYASNQAGNRYFLPEEIAEVVNFLLSDISACISGEVITCDQSTWVKHW